MITTYVIETESQYGYDVLNYAHTLADAKQIALRYKETKPSILQLKGSSFGEGFHQYRLQLNDNNQFECVETMNLSRKKLNKVY
jgi:hypothetical protein